MRISLKRFQYDPLLSPHPPWGREDLPPLNKEEVVALTTKEKRKGSTGNDHTSRIWQGGCCVNSLLAGYTPHRRGLGWVILRKTFPRHSWKNNAEGLITGTRGARGLRMRVMIRCNCHSRQAWRQAKRSSAIPSHRQVSQNTRKSPVRKSRFLISLTAREHQHQIQNELEVKFLFFFLLFPTSFLTWRVFENSWPVDEK